MPKTARTPGIKINKIFFKFRDRILEKLFDVRQKGRIRHVTKTNLTNKTNIGFSSLRLIFSKIGAKPQIAATNNARRLGYKYLYYPQN